MADSSSWAWVSDTLWPGFDPNNQDNLGTNGNGLPVNPNGYKNVTWVDGNDDGLIIDADTDDNSPGTVDGVKINGQVRTVAEIGCYDGTNLMVDGSTVTVTMPVWLFTDGTWMARINDADIPMGKHYSQVTSITLGNFVGVDYDGTWTSNRVQSFVCFVAGTLIDTATGPRPVEMLRAGDAVRTADDGLQPLVWVGQRRVAGMGAMAPVRFAAGAIGNRRAPLVSPQHRMLVGGWRAQLLFGSDEVLVPARALINDHNVRRWPQDHVTYVHILFARHQIVFSEGAPSESFHPGATAMDALGAATRSEILSLFPQLANAAAGYGPAARPALRPWEGRLLRAPVGRMRSVP